MELKTQKTLMEENIFQRKKLIKENIKGTHHTIDITSGLVKKAPIKEEADYSLHYSSSSFKGGLHTCTVYCISPVKLQKPYLIRLHLV